MTTASDVLALALGRIQRVEPSLASGVGRWFDRNADFLQPIAKAILKQYQRSGQALTERSPDAVVAQLLNALQAGAPALLERAARFQPLMRLIVESCIQILVSTPPSIAATAAAALTVELPTKPSVRLATNAEAIKIAARGLPPSEAERAILLRYTGNGGLSLEKLAELVPAEWVPKTKALVDEYYTLPEVCAAAAELIAMLVGPEGLHGPALEPSVGIGRFIGAFSGRADMRGLAWTGVEYSKVSAAICRLLYPFATIVNEPFEQWVAENYNEVANTLALVVTNPPYGKRGANKTLDPDKFYRDELAYTYMVRRSFDMLRPGGYGVALVPQGFISGTGPAHRKVREQLLIRHHLLCAFRLPSNIYPGAEIVTDISFWQARGGELLEVLPEDMPILDGSYFAIHPAAILGEEKESSRGRYQVVGDFRGFPTPEIRSQCTSCSLTPFSRPIERKPLPEEYLSPEMFGLHLLGQRVERYLGLLASASARDSELAASMHGELTASLTSWQQSQRARFGEYHPRQDPEIVQAANTLPSIAAILAIFGPDGNLVPSLQHKPTYSSSYVGPSTVAAHAEWLYAKNRRLTLASLQEFRVAQGLASEDFEVLETALVAQEWCEDWEDSGAVWLPARDYYTGDLWPRIDRARVSGLPRAVVQLARLLELVGTVTLEEAAPAIREGWIPTEITQGFLTAYLKIEIPMLHWYQALLKPVGVNYAQLGKLDERLQTALGYINHDLSWFHPPYEKRTDPDSGEEESAEAALDRARLDYGTHIVEAFNQWLSTQTEYQQRILETYKRTFRGYVVPDYPPDPLPIARWGRKITLKPHQLAGAWRLVKANGGLCAYDVGVGKTLTGCATVAYLRQVGRARRPLIIVPNTIIWKWQREITRALPDYRVCVIGSVRYLGRDGTYRSRLDEKAERLTKWSEFQLGLYDAALCTYSVFANTTLSEEALRQYVEETPSVMRAIGLKTARLDSEIEKLDSLYDKREQLASKIAQLKAEQEGAPMTLLDDEAEDDDGDDDGEAEGID